MNAFDPTEISTPRPLTRTKKDGTLYRREAGVEAELREMAGLGERARRERLLLAVRAQPGFVREETLVCYLRVYAAHNDLAMAWQIAERIVDRVAGHVARQVKRWRLGPDDADDCARDLFALLHEALFDCGPGSEFWEVRFWVCLDRRLWNLLERRQAVSDNERQIASAENDENGAGEDRLAILTDPAPRPDVLAERREALAQLTENERLSVYLRYVEGLPEESDDPARPSIARILGVTGRSVRNYLRQAEAKLHQWNASHEPN